MTNASVLVAPGFNPPQTTPPLFRALENSISSELHVSSDGEYTCGAKIWSASDGFLRLVVDVPIVVGASVELSFEGCRTEGEVAFCQQWSGGYNVGVQLMNNRSVRREPRFPIQIAGRLTVLGDQGPQRISVELIDVSASGVGLIAPERIAVGVCVEITLEHGVLFGEIRHCEVENGRFRAGVKMYHMVAKAPPDRAKSSSNLLAWLKRPK
jgi:hypothetical protein